MTESFETLGFLSSDIDEFRNSVRAEFSADFDNVEHTAALAIAELQAVSGDVPPTYIVGTAFWLRCVESCQATVLLAERGMSTSPQATLRTAFECLFAACALWRKPEIADKIQAWHHQERIKQAQQLLLVAGVEKRLTPKHLADLKTIAAEQPPSSGWSHREAAHVAGLQYEYEMMYRGLSIGGAHASPRSLDDFHTAKPDGSMDLQMQPSSDRTAWLLGLVVMCLSLGIARHHEARSAAQS